MKDYIETQYKNLDFTIPDDYVSRREVYAIARLQKSPDCVAFIAITKMNTSLNWKKKTRS